ncbi:hypothetical protein TNIN_386221 [Trichonephila inaurata madagascariensis]|uniref:Uncharacterized protein n=1 Tax=Trichonephila inaurata madagascariensis TaxID=2747483 RepID=A0A8X6YAP1_9ARAC|nr:hypothetical protein TNIN_386221 [Trichonephila inaurata madagascariensis]
MPWRLGDCTDCRSEKLSNACIGASNKHVCLSVRCTTQGVLGVGGLCNLKSICYVILRTNLRRARKLYLRPKCEPNGGERWEPKAFDPIMRSVCTP